MDEARLKDIAHLQSVIDNPLKSKWVRNKAHLTKQHIVAQMKDGRLRDMRWRLIQAVQANDELEEWKIANQIKDYLHERKLELPT